MDKLLLDTITFDWLLHNPAQIPAKTRTLIEQADDVFVCIASMWELANHVRQGQLVLFTPFEQYMKKALRSYHITLMPVEWEALAYMSTFEYQIIERPWSRTEAGKTVKGIKRELHKDTFDRLIIAHALTNRLPIITPDELFPYYEPLGLKVVWR